MNICLVKTKFGQLFLCIILLLFITCKQYEVSFPPSNTQMVEAFNDKFGLDIQYAPIIYNEFLDIYVSVVYKDTKMYRLYIKPNGSIHQRVITPLFPKDEITVLCVVRLPDDLLLLIDSIKTLWEKAQTGINDEHRQYASTLGLKTPVISFKNYNVFVPQSAFSTSTTTDYLQEFQNFASNTGLNLAQFQIKIILDLNIHEPNGGWADWQTGIAKVGWIYNPSTQIDEKNFSGIAFATYHHEIGHIFGWEHDWTDPYYEGSFIAHPELFGWKDLDFDGSVEILDKNPYGSN